MGKRRKKTDLARRRPTLKVGGIFAVVAVIALTSVLIMRSANSAIVSPARVTSSVPESFVRLAAARTDVCRDLGNKSAMERYMNSLPDGSMFQGSCCSPMNLSKYTSQVNGLKQYHDISEIPKDPYSVSVVSTKQMVGFYNNIDLTATQKGAYDTAASRTDDSGWCCCQCWAWYAHAGLAKFLITRKNFTATQVAAVTSLEDCCGGA